MSTLHLDWNLSQAGWLELGPTSGLASVGWLAGVEMQGVLL